jgi:hypothetical protein
MVMDFTGRAHRRFYVYRDGLHVLTIGDEPGHLVSTASPPPGGAPKHPFLDGSAHQAVYENELAGLLGRAASFDGYLDLLLQAGYDIASDDTLPNKAPGAGVRLLKGDSPVGAAWHRGGQFTCLWQQPARGELVFQQARLSVYRPEWAEALFTTLQAAVSYEAFCEQVQEQELLLVNFRVRLW